MNCLEFAQLIKEIFRPKTIEIAVPTRTTDHISPRSRIIFFLPRNVVGTIMPVRIDGSQDKAKIDCTNYKVIKMLNIAFTVPDEPNEATILSVKGRTFLLMPVRDVNGDWGMEITEAV